MSKAEKRNPFDLLSQSDAARVVGVSRPTIPAMVARGELDGEMIGTRLHVTRVSAERAKRVREKRANAAA